jgi:hypothetical protein
MSTAVAERPAPLSRVWSGNKIIAEDLTRRRPEATY